MSREFGAPYTIGPERKFSFGKVFVAKNIETPKPVFSLSEEADFKELESRNASLVHDASVKGIAEGTVNFINYAIKNEIDTIFYLDKSARPAGTLVRHTWRKIQPDTEEPKSYFINVGRHQGRLDKNYSSQIGEALRSAYGDTQPTNILVADECTDKGTTLDRAVRVVKDIYPEAANVYGKAMYPTVPYWFGKKEIIGVQEDLTIGNGPEKYISEAYDGSKKLAHEFRKELIDLSSLIAENTTQIFPNEK